MNKQTKQKPKGKIPSIAYKDFLINVKEPKRTDKTYVKFWLKHIERCKSGVYVGGIFFSGWLYWHLNFFKITISVEDEYGNDDTEIVNLDFRDNEYYFDFYHRLTDKDKRLPLIAFGTRRFAKTVLIASRIAYKAFIFRNTHAVIIGVSKVDLNNITKYFNEYYQERQDCFSDLQKVGDWSRDGGDVAIAFSKRKVTAIDPVTKKKKEINPMSFEFLDIRGDDTYHFSTITVRNLEHGQVKSKEQLLAGITPTEVIWDEVGKTNFAPQRSALLPALKASYGLRTTEILTGTGGNVDFSESAEKAFLTPDKTGFFVVDLNLYSKEVKEKYFPYKHKKLQKGGLFVPAEMSLYGVKEDVPIYDYFKRDFSDKEKKELEGFTIKVTNWEKSKEEVLKALEIEKNKSDTEYKMAQMFLPFQPEDCFLFSGKNPFPIEALKARKQYLLEEGLLGEYVELVQLRNGYIEICESKKSPVQTYPFDGGSHDAPAIIYERPIHDDPNLISRGIYVAGFDGYKIGVSETTDSVGSLHIYKRKMGISGYQDRLVVSYATRPSEDNIFYNQSMLLLKKYNAEVLPETDTNFYKYMQGQGALKYWADCKNLAQGININTKANTNYGLPATAKNQQHFLKLMKQYCNEKLIVGYEEDGVTPITVMGCDRIDDIMLLEELIKFGKEKNFDRIISFGHALAWDNELGVNNIIANDGTRDTQIKKERMLQKVIWRRKTRKVRRRR